MEVVKKGAWSAFKDVAMTFLVNKKDPNLKSIVETMLQKYQNLQTLMMADYCWMLHRDEPTRAHARKSRQHSMTGQKRQRHK
ncbi:hypothetical protein QE152_g28390 [Popillia japonica]|uniref:Uncharacterized protein n=1 Tax=Popillia japonica TaxID=7064 RepID=A0AAW1JK00_POPJA